MLFLTLLLLERLAQPLPVQLEQVHGHGEGVGAHGEKPVLGVGGVLDRHDAEGSGQRGEQEETEIKSCSTLDNVQPDPKTMQQIFK